MGQRYEPDARGAMYPHEDGRWVLYEDCAEARASQPLTLDVERLRGTTRPPCLHPLSYPVRKCLNCGETWR